MHPRIVLAVLALVALAAIPPALSSGSLPTFGSPVALPQSAGFGEPSIAVAPLDGTIYVTAPCPASPVWRSVDNGAHFLRVASSRGACGDSDISISPDGTVYVSDLFNNVPVSVSHDKATSFPFVSQSFPDNSNDRQWLATPANGLVYSGVNNGGNFRVATSHDGAATWPALVSAFTDGSFPPPGQMFAPTANDVYIPYLGSSGHIRLAISHDGALTWVSHDVAPQSLGAYLFPVAARDAAGTLYVAWVDDGESPHVEDGTRVLVSDSTNDGATWSAPRELSQRASSDTSGVYNLFPWIVADAAGHVAVSWFEGDPPQGIRTAHEAAALTPWSVHVAYSPDASDANPTWSQGAATGTIYTGPICTGGTGCVPAANPVAESRVLLDFFEMAERSDGSLVIAYPGNQPGPTASIISSTQLYVVAQNGGPLLK